VCIALASRSLDLACFGLEIDLVKQAGHMLPKDQVSQRAELETK